MADSREMADEFIHSNKAGVRHGVYLWSKPFDQNGDNKRMVNNYNK